MLGQSPGKFLLLDSIAIWFKLHKELFSLPFKTSKVAIYSPEFTVLPDKTDNAREVFQLLGFSDNENITYLKNKLSDSFYVYYSLPDRTINFIENHLLNVEFYCGDFGLLSFYNSKLSFKNYLAANLYGEELTLCYKKDATNFYYNKFPVKAKEDLLYYLRLAYEHLGLDLNEFASYLYGFIEEKSPMYSTSYGYIRNFEIDRTLKNTLPFMYSIEDIPLHYYINLLGLGLN
ncbi:MAG: uncharacterized protein JWN78_624 [Bacteroidota bacterium]|nr:uncharacterized protein [Bacteroidota bacterium]